MEWNSCRISFHGYDWLTPKYRPLASSLKAAAMCNFARSPTSIMLILSLGIYSAILSFFRIFTIHGNEFPLIVGLGSNWGPNIKLGLMTTSLGVDSFAARSAFVISFLWLRPTASNALISINVLAAGEYRPRRICSSGSLKCNTSDFLDPLLQRKSFRIACG